MSPELQSLSREVSRFIDGTGASMDPACEARFDALALGLFRAQFDANPVYRAFCLQRGIGPGDITGWRAIPALPTAAFQVEGMTCLDSAEACTVFHSSGTTGQVPSRHRHSRESLALYERSAARWFGRHLAGTDTPHGLRWLCLTPPPARVPHSSLAHMLGVVTRDAGAPEAVFKGRLGADGGWEVDVDAVRSVLDASVRDGVPVALLGTAFNCVHLLDAAEGRGWRWRLPEGSRVMETGGYKGRSRVLSRAELHAALERVLSIPGDHRVSEYGMAELGSQAYDRVVGGASDPNPGLAFPGWARVRIVSPETGGEVADGDTGLVEVVDLANVASAVAVRTGDLAIRRGSRLELLGRAGRAEPRGCSLLSAPIPAGGTPW